MTEDEIQKLTEGVIETIEKVVNGKIDRLEKKLDDHNIRHEAHFQEVRGFMEETNAHMAETKPIIQAYHGFNTAGELVKWVAGVGTAVGVLFLLLRQWLGLDGK